MSIVRYDPFRDLRTLQEEVNRLFTGNITRGFDEEGIARGAWSPSVDIYENKDHIVLEAELPGMKREDFDLSVENNVITLRGERHFEKKDESDNYHRVERAYGSFTRSFTLPTTVNTEDIKADYEQGVLKVRLAKRTEAKPKQIKVSVGGQKPVQGQKVETQAQATGQAA